MDTIGAVAIPLSCEGGDKMFAAKLERIRSLLRANFRSRSGWRRARDGIQYVEHNEGHGEKLFEAVCDLGLEGIVSKRGSAVMDAEDRLSDQEGRARFRHAARSDRRSSGGGLCVRSLDA
jgi:hypothetical protein